MDEEQPATHDVELNATLTTTASLEKRLELGVDDISLAVLGILVSIGLSFGFGVPGSFWVKLIAGGGSFVAACALIKVQSSRNVVVKFARWLTGPPPR